MKIRNTLIIATALIAASTALLSGRAKNDDGINLPENAVIYDSEDLTYDILTNRTSDVTIVERIVGVVLDDEGNGHIINDNDGYDYISYKYVENAKPGDLIVTYSIYNTENQYEDDIVERYDLIVASDDIQR